MIPREKPKRTIALDYGLARIGVAVSDPTKTLASPWKNILASKKTPETVKSVIAECEAICAHHGCEIDLIVIGLPLMMSGKSGLSADEVKHFKAALEAAQSIPIVLWDERLTTVQAERSMREGAMSRKKRAQKIDSVAAIIILQNYLDFKGFSML
jgi:putative Holliday junction resolvase